MKLERQLIRNKEKEEVKKLHKEYKKKPTEKCPRCGKLSIFYKCKDGEIYCLRCENRVDKN